MKFIEKADEHLAAHESLLAQVELSGGILGVLENHGVVFARSLLERNQSDDNNGKDKKEEETKTKKKLVKLVCGGGSGHEPSHNGFVGKGMLSASVNGRVFSSPSSSSVLAAIVSVASPNCLLMDEPKISEEWENDVLVIVKNYTGDRLNFGVAVEKAKGLGIGVEMVIVDDDSSIPRGQSAAGRRGLAGTLFIHKIAGALASQGEELSKIVEIIHEVISNIGTVGVSLCQQKESNEEEDHEEQKKEKKDKGDKEETKDYFELGLGIHGEPGYTKIKKDSISNIITKILDTILDNTPSRGYFQPPLEKGEDVAMIINNLGGISMLEFSIISKKAIHQVESRGFNVRRAYSGHLMSSLDMPGFSITLLRLNHSKYNLISALDYSVEVTSWPTVCYKKDPEIKILNLNLSSLLNTSSSTQVIQNLSSTGEKFKNILTSVCNSLIEAEPILTEYDKKVGDGDCGETFKIGAEGLLSKKDEIPFDQPKVAFEKISEIIQEKMGGSSGFIYFILFYFILFYFNSKKKKSAL